MIVEDATGWMCPSAEIYRLSEGELTFVPEVVQSYHPDRACHAEDLQKLVIMTFDVEDETNLWFAIRFARVQKTHVLRIAVLQMKDERLNDADDGPLANRIKMLRDAFDIVFPAVKKDAEDVIRRFVRTMTGGPSQSIRCDWRDIRHIVGGRRGSTPARFGFGRGRGGQRFMQAVGDALNRIRAQDGGMKDASGICILIASHPDHLFGRDIRDVTAHVRSCLKPEATIAIAVEYADTMPEEEAEVDVFAFGGKAKGDPVPAIRQGVGEAGGTALSGVDCIPAYLSKS